MCASGIGSLGAEPAEGHLHGDLPAVLVDRWIPAAEYRGGRISLGVGQAECDAARWLLHPALSVPNSNKRADDGSYQDARPR